MSFIETPRFPETIRYNSIGGPEFSVDIIVLQSGHEQRNANWSQSRHSYQIGNIKKQSDIETILSFYHAMHGPLHGFRFKDWLDYKSCGVDSTPAATDQEIGTGDGATLTFQTVKNYTTGALTQQREINKIVSGSYLLAISGASDTGTRWSVNANTGLVTFSANKNNTVTNATSSGTETILTVGIGHSMGIGDTVYCSTFTGDWSGMNGGRYTITALPGAGTQITVDHDSSSYAAYSGNAGETDSLPQASESITAGYEFDVPVRFGAVKLDMSIIDKNIVGVNMPIIEIRV